MKVRNLLMTAFVCAGLATGALAAVNLEAEIENGKKLIKSGDFKKSPSARPPTAAGCASARFISAAARPRA